MFLLFIVLFIFSAPYFALEYEDAILDFVDPAQCPHIEIFPHTLEALKWHVHVNKKYKWIHCGIPKVGCTQFWKLFYRLQQDSFWNINSPHIIGPPYHDTADSAIGSVLNFSEANQIFNDRSWTLSVFFRDPIERLISAYKDKLAQRSYLYKFMDVPENTPLWTFNEFIEHYISAHDKTDIFYGGVQSHFLRTDPHFCSQLDLCELRRLLPRFNFIGFSNFFEEDSRMLLNNLGLWEEFASSGFGVNGDQSIFSPQDVYANTVESNTVVSKMFTPKLLKRVLSMPHIQEQLLFLWQLKLPLYHPQIHSCARVRNFLNFHYAFFQDRKNPPVSFNNSFIEYMFHRYLSFGLRDVWARTDVTENVTQYLASPYLI